MKQEFEYIFYIILYIVILLLIFNPGFKTKEIILSAEDVRKVLLDKKKKDQIITLKYIVELLKKGEKEVKIEQNRVDGYMLDILRRKGYNVGEKGSFYIITL